MNFEKDLEDRLENHIEYLVTSGSRLYGTHHKDSDYDTIGFIVPPFDALIGVRNFEQKVIMEGNTDHKVYSFWRYLNLISNSDPQLTETLFVPEDKIEKMTDIGKKVRDNRSLFISNRIYKRIMGYGYSEWRKAMGERLVIEKRPKTLEDVIASVRNTKILNKEETDQFVEWMQKGLKHNIIPSKKNLGSKRKAEFDNYGYGVSSASHAIRLCCQLIELMQTGYLTFPRPESDILRAIRSGEIDKLEAKKIYDEKVELAEEARDNSILPDRPNQKKIFNLYREIVAPKLAISSKQIMRGD